MKDMPIAEINGARRPELRRRRYASLSMPALRSAQTTTATTSARIRPKTILSGILTFQCACYRKNGQRCENADHVYIAMSKVDQLDNAVYHCISQCDNGDDRAVGKTNNQEIEPIEVDLLLWLQRPRNIQPYDRSEKENNIKNKCGDGESPPVKFYSGGGFHVSPLFLLVKKDGGRHSCRPRITRDLFEHTEGNVRAVLDLIEGHVDQAGIAIGIEGPGAENAIKVFDRVNGIVQCSAVGGIATSGADIFDCLEGNIHGLIAVDRVGLGQMDQTWLRSP